MNAFGNRLLVGRLEKGLTQSELGRRVRATPSQVCLWESGNHFPRPATLPKLADALGIEPKELAQLYAEALLEKREAKSNPANQ